MRRFLIFLGVAVLSLQTLAVAAKEYKPLYPNFPTIRESKAYQKFARRPLTDFSKILYLIDRYGDSQIQIVYDNQTYTAPFATTVARWFLARNYKKQTPSQWINQWCHTSVMSGHPIYVKLPNGEFRLAKEVLLEEQAALEEVIKENQEIANANQQIAYAAPVPDVPIAVNPANAAAHVPAEEGITQNLRSAGKSKNLEPALR